MKMSGSLCFQRSFGDLSPRTLSKGVESLLVGTPVVQELEVWRSWHSVVYRQHEIRCVRHYEIISARSFDYVNQRHPQVLILYIRGLHLVVPCTPVTRVLPSFGYPFSSVFSTCSLGVRKDSDKDQGRTPEQRFHTSSVGCKTNSITIS